MKIGLCGTMSVGKTTLVKALKELPEFKTYNFATERSKYLNDLGIPLNTDSTLKGQTVFLAERCAELMNNNIITDRTVIDVMAFTLNAKSIHHQDKDIFRDVDVGDSITIEITGKKFELNDEKIHVVGSLLSKNTKEKGKEIKIKKKKKKAE